MNKCIDKTTTATNIEQQKYKGTQVRQTELHTPHTTTHKWNEEKILMKRAAN